jgi:hypothetical protein
LENENILHVDAIESKTAKEEEEASLKLLLAKMPENNFNKEVPLKMVRTMRKPKAVPSIIRKKFGHVNVHQKTAESTNNVEEPMKTEVAPVQPIFDTKKEEQEVASVAISEPKPEPTPVACEEVKNDEMMQDIETPANNSEEKIIAVVNTEEEDCEISAISPAKCSKNVTEDDEEEVMDTNEATWLNDISVMIGESRIKEIDQGLKKIPSIVTGNKIQTENVELKLIINHLLAKLKAETVTETLDEPSTSGLNLNGMLYSWLPRHCPNKSFAFWF